MKRSCRRARALLARGFVGAPLRDRHYRVMWRELGVCADCREAYDEMIELERAMSSETGAASGPAPFELELVRHRVLGAIQAPRERTRAWPWIVAPLWATAVLGLFLWPKAPSDGDELLARGPAGAATVSVFCQSAREIVPATDACAQGSSLVFAYTAPGEVRISVHWESAGRGGWLAEDVLVSPSPVLAPLGKELVGVTGDVTLTLVTHDNSLSETERAAALRGSPASGMKLRRLHVRLSP